MMKRLTSLNPHIPVHHIEDLPFSRYGRVLTGYDFSAWIKYLAEETQIPEQGNVYVPGDSGLEALPPSVTVRDTIFAGMPIQVGFCNGRNSRLNGLEYHKAPEVLVAQTDLVLQLADFGCMDNYQLDVKHVEAFFVPAGGAIELKATALHLAPCKVFDSGFKALIVLLEGTNTDLSPDVSIERDDPESRLLFKKGKWMLAHPENPVAIARGAVPALIGPNLEIYYK